MILTITAIAGQLLLFAAYLTVLRVNRRLTRRLAELEDDNLRHRQALDLMGEALMGRHVKAQDMWARYLIAKHGPRDAETLARHWEELQQ